MACFQVFRLETAENAGFATACRTDVLTKAGWTQIFNRHLPHRNWLKAEAAQTRSGGGETASGFRPLLLRLPDEKGLPTM